MKPRILYCNFEKCWICGIELLEIESRTLSWVWVEGETPKEAYLNFIRLYGESL